MHLQWKIYELKNGQRSLRAELVKSYRDKITSLPRNKVVCYLGSIRESNLKFSLARDYFWWQVNIKLYRLSLSATERKKIIENISERVPLVSKIVL